MSLSDIRHTLSFLDKLLYVALAILGFFFIYHGEVIQRFNKGKTFFAEYNEALDEFPTITTYFLGKVSSKPKYGKDFNISMGAYPDGEPVRNLSFGENTIPGSTLKVYFEPFGQWSQDFRITPLNFDPEMPVTYQLKYKFGKIPLPKVGLRLTTAIGNIGRVGEISFSTEDEEHQCQIGERRLLIISATKYKNLNCTNKSPAESMIRRALQEMPKRCLKPCQIQPKHFSMGFKMVKFFRHLPLTKRKVKYNAP